MFQYATAYSYAKKYNKELIINVDSYSGYIWKQDAGFVLDKIMNKVIIAEPSFWTVFFEKGYSFEIIGKILRKIFQSTIDF